MKKKSKKTAKSRKPSPPSGASENLALLIKEGVVIESDRLSDGEKAVIDSLTPEEVAALRSVYEKFSRVDPISPFWRAFCF